MTEQEMEEYIEKENPKLILSSVDENEYQDCIIGMTCWGEFVKASDIFGKGV